MKITILLQAHNKLERYKTNSPFKAPVIKLSVKKLRLI